MRGHEIKTKTRTAVSSSPTRQPPISNRHLPTKAAIKRLTGTRTAGRKIQKTKEVVNMVMIVANPCL